MSDKNKGPILQSLTIERDRWGGNKDKLIGKIEVKGQDYSTTVVLEDDEIHPILIEAAHIIVRALQKTAAVQEAELLEALGIAPPNTKRISNDL